MKPNGGFTCRIIMVTKRKRKRKDKIPYGSVRKPIPRPGGFMKDKKKYNRKTKHKINK